MKYKINWIEQKQTSTGKIKADVTLELNGTLIEKVTIWGDFPNFANLAAGSEIEGDVVEKQNGKFTNRTLYPARTDTKSAPRAPAWAAGAKAAVVEKNKGIAVAQENKQEGIKISSTFRDATLITIAYFGGETSFTEGDFKKKWLEVRNWLWKNFDTSEDRESAPIR